MKLSKRQLSALLRFASTDPSRINIYQVWFQGKTAVATDGHRLAYVSDNTPPPPLDESGFAVPADDLRSFVKSMLKHDQLALGPRKSMLRNTKTGRTADVSGVLGRSKISFPPYEQVFPKRQSRRQRVTAFQPAYLADVRYLADLADVERVTAIPWFSEGIRAPVTFIPSVDSVCDSDPCVGILVMPVLCSETDPQEPC